MARLKTMNSVMEHKLAIIVSTNQSLQTMVELILIIISSMTVMLPGDRAVIAILSETIL